MTNTRNQEVDKAIKDHDKAISELQASLAIMMSQQEQILKALNENKVITIDASGSGKKVEGDERFGNRTMRIGKVEFPRFNGENVEGWIYRCEHFFNIDETPDNLKLRHAAIHLEGDAIEWHQSFMKTRGVTVAEFPWEDYVQAITSRFSNAMFEDAMEEIASLTQIGSLKEYNSSFDSLLNKVSICEAYAVSLYLKGLKPEIKGPVKMFKPQTLHKAYGLARIQDINNKNLMNQLAGLEDGSRIVKNENESEKITPPVNASKLPLLPDPTGVPGPPAYKPATINAKRLSGEELELKKSKGECFWCTEKFVPGHKCKKKQLFVINVEGDEETEQDDNG